MQSDKQKSFFRQTLYDYMTPGIQPEETLQNLKGPCRSEAATVRDFVAFREKGSFHEVGHCQCKEYGRFGGASFIHRG